VWWFRPFQYSSPVSETSLNYTNQSIGGERAPLLNCCKIPHSVSMSLGLCIEVPPNMVVAYLPTLVFVYAGQCHSYCRILLAFAGQYCVTVLLAENLDTLRLTLNQIFTPSLKTCLLTPWAMVLNFSPTGIHPVAGTDPDPNNILSWSHLYLIV